MATPATPGGFAPTTDSPPAQSPQGESAADSRRPTAPQQSGADTDLGSSAQRERRRRILDSTLALASKGGYDAVQMRAVADRADVAVGRGRPHAAHRHPRRARPIGRAGPP